MKSVTLKIPKKLIDLVAGASDTTMENGLNEAIALYSWLKKEVRKGNEIIIRDKYDNEKVIDFSTVDES